MSDSGPAHGAWMPRIQDRAEFFGSLVECEWAASHDNADQGFARRGQLVHKLLLRSRQIEKRPRSRFARQYGFLTKKEHNHIGFAGNAERLREPCGRSIAAVFQYLCVSDSRISQQLAQRGE